jgi:hypothetical protein
MLVFGCGLGEGRVLRLAVLRVLLGLVEAGFLVVEVFGRVVLGLDFAVVLRLVWVIISS